MHFDGGEDNKKGVLSTSLTVVQSKGRASGVEMKDGGTPNLGMGL